MNELRNGTNNRFFNAGSWIRSSIHALVVTAFTFSISPIWADTCDKRVQPIKSGETAPCSGFLFSDEAEKDAARARDDAKYYKELSDKLIERNKVVDKESEILERRLQLYVTQSDMLAEKLTKEESKDFWQKALYFGLGAIITGGIAYGVVNTLK